MSLRTPVCTVLLGAVALGAGCARATPVRPVESLQVGDPSFLPTMAGNTRSPIVAGNDVRVLLNGDEFFPLLLDAIRSAKKTITFLQYVYEKSDVGEEIAGALAERCRAGVGVSVLLDYTGSLKFPQEYTRTLTDAGCHVAFFRPLKPWQFNRFNYRNHRRIVVVDGRLGFTGGFGINEKWTGDGRQDQHWRDTQVRLEGPIVGDLQAAFAQNWREATGLVLTGDAYFPALTPTGTVRAQVVGSSPRGGSYEAYMLFRMAIDSARKSIYLTNPYFVPDDQMVKALTAAAARGVRVVVLVPGKIDHNLVREASRRGFARFFDAGIELWEYQAALLHAKTVIVDGEIATIGSTNLDNRSFALNEELDLTVYDRGVARRMEAIFEDDLAHSRRVTREAWARRGLKARLFELFAWPLESQM